MKLVFFGAPGAGKGTVAKIIFEKNNLVQISTGDLFRAAIKNQTDLGKKVSSILDAGDLVPDELTVALVAERIKEDDCKNGYILDGFPRTIGQAKSWEGIDPIGKAVYFDIDDDIVIKRLGGRRICQKCGAIYNVYFNKPKVEGKCDHDGEALIIRKDDNEESIANRLDVYHKQTEPLLDYYKNLGKVISIDASVNPEKSYNQIIKQISL